MKRPDFSQPYLSIVIPVYNEEKTLRRVVARVLEVPGLREAIVVNDGSSDQTAAIADAFAVRDPRVRVLHHARNKGKTEALKTGFAQTTGEIVVVQDADLEYDPGEIPGLIQPIVEGYADVVYGSRFLVRRAARVLYFYHYLANRFLTFFSNLLTNVNLTDVETGYKAFRGDIIREMRITAGGFGFEIEVTAKLAKLRCAIYESPISYYGRTYEDGKKIGLRDGVAALWYVLKFNLFCGLKRSYRQIPSVRAERELSNQVAAGLP
ncbi:MAG TPA: glycosyltransferase family 2 protein [Bryobacteraceae bacterium]|jgi:glycosyltransferase involved in cell wall biosynthesis|nr:glycosyltransferase family 2 protein [Bryobacteraceae bacterium]